MLFLLAKYWQLKAGKDPKLSPKLGHQWKYHNLSSFKIAGKRKTLQGHLKSMRLRVLQEDLGLRRKTIALKSMLSGFYS
jgi:hypothetical protein